MKPFRIPAGTTVMLGAPAQPMDTGLSSAIGELTDSIDGVLEAHLPQCFAVGVTEHPAQVLVVVLDPGVRADQVLEAVGQGLDGILPPGQHLDVWPMFPNDKILSDVRKAGCRISGDA